MENETKYLSQLQAETPGFQERLQDLQSQIKTVKEEFKPVSEELEYKSAEVAGLKNNLLKLDTLTQTFDKELSNIADTDAQARVVACKKNYDEIVEELKVAQNKVVKQEALIAKTQV